MNTLAKLEIEGKLCELPIIIGSEGEQAVDIAKLRDQTETGRRSELNLP
jgi:hypothetical protein